MGRSDSSGSGKLWRWVRWILGSEAALLVLAIIGPGDNVGADRSNPTAISGLFIDDPSFIETVVVNFVAFNLMVLAVFLAGWVATRRKRRRERGEKRDGDG